MDELGVTDVRELRAGGQKTVRLVNRAGNELVMKVISLESGAPDTLRRAQREVELLQEINSNHAVKVASGLVELDDPIRGVAWLEEYLNGEDLSDLLGAAWDWNEAKAMALDVAEGLRELHAVDVVHRDLSANNVRRTSDGRYVVMDPGFARHTLRSGLTVGGQPGTPGFLSPEHLQSFSGVPMPASDVFCLGILVFYALTGQAPIPFTGDMSDYLTRLFRVEAHDVEDFRDDLGADVVVLVRRMLHPQPARRHRNGERLKEALEALRDTAN
jgi:eukaryotic-like serine/threonine-protein kinase